MFSRWRAVVMGEVDGRFNNPTVRLVKRRKDGNAWVERMDGSTNNKARSPGRLGIRVRKSTSWDELLTTGDQSAPRLMIEVSGECTSPLSNVSDEISQESSVTAGLCNRQVFNAWRSCLFLEGEGDKQHKNNDWNSRLEKLRYVTLWMVTDW